jgi:hypothetical protein
MQEIRNHVETCVLPSVIEHAHVNPRLTPIEEKPLWLDSEYTKIEYFSHALDWDGMKWILTGMWLTDEHGSGITREEYWLHNANNKYLFWPRRRLPILHMQDIPYEEGSLHPVDWSRR